MQYTCNKCQTRNVIDVNPHAYKTGSVFVQCGGCGVRHKLIDNLGVTHDFCPSTSRYLGVTTSAQAVSYTHLTLPTTPYV